MNDRDIDPSVKKFFPWALFLVLAALCFYGAIKTAHGAEVPASLTCADVVERVGMKPLALAEREARREYPDITDAQIAWGRQCVADYRRALLDKAKAKVKGYFQ